MGGIPSWPPLPSGVGPYLPPGEDQHLGSPPPPQPSPAYARVHFSFYPQNDDVHLQARPSQRSGGPVPSRASSSNASQTLTVLLDQPPRPQAFLGFEGGSFSLQLVEPAEPQGPDCQMSGEIAPGGHEGVGSKVWWPRWRRMTRPSDRWETLPKPVLFPGRTPGGAVGL